MIRSASLIVVFVIVLHVLVACYATDEDDCSVANSTINDDLSPSASKSMITKRSYYHINKSAKRYSM